MINRRDRNELVRYNYINGELTNLIYSRASVEAPAISKGSEYIYYTAKDSAGYDIYRINENGPVAADITEQLIDSLLNYCFTDEDSAIIAQAYFSVGDRNTDARPLYKSARIFRECGYLSGAENLFERLISLPPALFPGLAEIELAKLNFDRNPKGDSIDASGMLKSALSEITRKAKYPEEVRGQAQLELARQAYGNGEIYRSLRMLVSLQKRYNSVRAVSSRAELLYLEIMKDNFPGDPLELVPLYLELSKKYQELTGFNNDVDSAIVAMLIESNDPEGYLRYLINNYIKSYSLIGRAKLQLAEILRYSGRANESSRLLEQLNSDNTLSADLKCSLNS